MSDEARRVAAAVGGDAKGQQAAIGNLVDSLQSLESHIQRRNSALDTLREYVTDAKSGRFEHDDVKDGLRMAMENLEQEMGVLEKKENELPSTVSSLGLAGYLASLPPHPNLAVQTNQDEKSPQHQYASLYEQLIAIYASLDRQKEYCSYSYQFLNQMMMRRPGSRPIIEAQRLDQRPQYMAPNQLDITRAWFKGVSQSFPALTWEIHLLPGTGIVVEMTIDRTFRMIMVLRGKILEAVNVRGSEETFNLEPRPLRPVDLWTPSAYETYRIITKNARSAMMHFNTPLNPDNTLRSFLQWVNSFASIFTYPCKRCGKFLDDFLPPTWRDYRKLEPYHESCRILTFSSY